MQIGRGRAERCGQAAQSGKPAVTPAQRSGRRIQWITLLWGLLPLLASAEAVEYLELRQFQLIDATGAPARTVQRLVAREGVIVQIDQAGGLPTLEPDARWTTIDLHGAWVMPGLIDTHVHVARFPDTREAAATILRRALRGGVVAVRDLGGDARALADLERAISSRELQAPTLVFSALFGGPDVFLAGPTAAMSAGRVPGHAPWARVIEPGADLPRLVAEASGSGARNIKLYGDLSPEQSASLIAEARRQGLLSTAHATVFPTRPSDLVAAGIGSLSHAAYLVWEAADSVPDDYQQRTAGPWAQIPADHPRLLALYRQMAERGVTLDATLYVYRHMQDYPGLPKMDWIAQADAWGVQATRHAHAAGVKVTTGTDWFEPRDDSELPHTHEELALLVEAAGFSPMDAILAATQHSAQALGIETSHGSVEVGKAADLLVLQRNPLDDIRNTTTIKFTISRGRVIEP